MSRSVDPIPADYRSATPMLAVRGADRAIGFYVRAFGATEDYRLEEPGGKIGHAEIRIGEARIMLADEYPEHNASPETLGGSSVIIHVYVKDVDAFLKQVAAAGAGVIRPAETQFYGDRSCKVRDPFGHVWMFSSRVEDVSPEEMQRRFAAYYVQ